VPGDDVEWRVVVLYLEEFPLEFVNYSPLFNNIFIPCNRDLEVTWVGQAIRADGSEVRNHKMAFVYFSDVTSRFSLKNIHRKFYASLNYTDFQGGNSHLSKLSLDQQSSMLRNNQQISIRRIKSLFLHIGIASIDHDSKTILHGGPSSSTHCNDTFNEVNFFLFRRELNGLPSELLRGNVKLWVLAIETREPVLKTTLIARFEGLV
jgi:hypothetical protein